MNFGWLRNLLRGLVVAQRFAVWRRPSRVAVLDLFEAESAGRARHLLPGRPRNQRPIGLLRALEHLLLVACFVLSNQLINLVHVFLGNPHRPLLRFEALRVVLALREQVVLLSLVGRATLVAAIAAATADVPAG